MKLFSCSDCGTRLSAREVAYESTHYVSGTASTRIRSISRYCAECHAVHEYKRQQAMDASVQELLDSLTTEQREAYLGRKADRS